VSSVLRPHQHSIGYTGLDGFYRRVWRNVCKDGLATFSINYDQEAEARRLRRQTISSPPTAGPRCHICDRICASDFGLRSHLQASKHYGYQGRMQ